MAKCSSLRSSALVAIVCASAFAPCVALVPGTSMTLAGARQCPLVPRGPALKMQADCTRRALLSATLALGSMTIWGPAAHADESGQQDVVMSGVLQANGLKLPSDASAVVTVRVVGRNRNGPLATLKLALDGKSLPLPFTVARRDLRDGVPDFVWVKEDLYIKCDIVDKAGKTLFVGRSKSKAVDGDVPSHGIAYVTLE